jgi:hypothetical protein
MKRRDVVDHALQRRAVLADLYAGRASALDVCDASPYLKSAAKRLGVQTERTCPVCRKAALHEVIRGNRLQYAEHIEGSGADAFREACRLGAEGIVSKLRDQPYMSA